MVKLQTDKDGYLTDINDWDLDIATQIATLEGIVLTEDHLEIIHWVRNFYLEYGISPAIRLLVKNVAASLGEAKGNSIYLYKLFPEGPAKQATKIAGLPKPAKCI